MMLVREMTDSECIALVADERVARLACAKDNVPYVVPIHYAYSGSRLYGFSMPGKKLDFLRSNPHVCLQIEKYRDVRHWQSVVVDASFQELSDTEQGHKELLHAWSLLERHFDWWEPGALKPRPQPVLGASPHVFFCLEVIDLSGREATEGDVPSIY